MKLSFYQTIRVLGAPFRFQVEGADHILDRGPAIYVANHLNSVGPIQTILSVPVRLYPWVIAEMTDTRRAPVYLFHDFIHPNWRLSGDFGMLVSTLVSKVGVRLLNGLGSVSVDRNSGWTGAAFRHSLKLLADSQNLVIFPEDPKQPIDPNTRMRPFLCGFIALCRMYEERTGKKLPVYPMVAHAGRKMVLIGQAMFFQNQGQRQRDIRVFCGQLKATMCELYLNIEHGLAQAE